MLWWEEIQEGVCQANQDTVAARSSECSPHVGAAAEVGGQEGADVNPSAPAVALGTAAINQAIKEGKASQTLRVLCNPDVALRGVVDACADAYQEQLAALMATKRPAGKTLGAAKPPPPWEPGVPPQPGCSGGAALQQLPSILVCRECEAILDPAQAAGWGRVLPEPADLGGQLAVPTQGQLQHHTSEPGGDPGMGRMGLGGHRQHHRG